MKEDRSITTERIDDFVVLLSLMQQMDLPGILDRHLPRHWLQQGLSWGWTASIWLAHIVSQGDHRKLTVRDWVRQAHSTLEQVTGLDIRETDFTDDRLTIVLRHLSDAARWQAIEQELGQHLVRVYELEEQPIRVDATTVSGYRNGGKDSLWQFGHSKDDPTLRQIKAMMATLDPLGLPLALEVVSGEQAADRFHVLRNLAEVVEKVLKKHRQALKTIHLVTTPATSASPLLRHLRPERERRKQQARTVLLERYEAVQRLVKQGISHSEISRRLRLHRESVIRYARAETFPERTERPTRPGILTPYETYLRTRWTEGERNAVGLFRELAARG